MRRRKLPPPPQLNELRAVQLSLDLPQTRIKPGTRILCLDSSKTGRVNCWHINHIISFPGGKVKGIERHLLVEIQ